MYGLLFSSGAKPGLFVLDEVPLNSVFAPSLRLIRRESRWCLEALARAVQALFMKPIKQRFLSCFPLLPIVLISASYSKGRSDLFPVDDVL
jgi:hypothetical protein